MHESGLATGERFGFGENWRNFIAGVDENRIREAERSLTAMLGIEDLRGRSFLDAGCGSGLFSLAAARLGAERIHSFDFDADSVAATAQLRAAHGNQTTWTIERGDVAQASYCAGVGSFDVVYAWGVLHHTGAMWHAMENMTSCVAPRGFFFISIYNDQGRKSALWRTIKKRYNRLPRAVRIPYAIAIMLPFELRKLAGALARGEPSSYFSGWTQPRDRGMSRWHDLIDWVGGYPYEVATVEEVFRFCRDRGLELRELVTTRSLGCNQFVFRRPAP